jgi:hypothetical protein
VMKLEGQRKNRLYMALWATIELSLYPGSNGKPLKCYKQGADMFRFAFSKSLIGNIVELHLWR